MVKQKMYMSGLEFVNKIVVQGERDFSHITLEEGYILGPEEEKMLSRYCHEKEKSFSRNPLNLKYASLRYLRAKNLFLPWVLSEGTDYAGVRLIQCGFFKGYFKDALFVEANLSPGPEGKVTSYSQAQFSGANFEKANLQTVSFITADLAGANFRSANLHSADFSNADLCGAQGLEAALGLEYATIKDTIVTEKEKKIIMASLSKKMFKKVVNSNIN